MDKLNEYAKLLAEQDGITPSAAAEKIVEAGAAALKLSLVRKGGPAISTGFSTKEPESE